MSRASNGQTAGRTGAMVCLAALGGLLLSAGCMSQRDMHRRIQSSRTQSYRQWQRTREDEEDPRPHVEGDLRLDDALTVAAAFNKSVQAALQEGEAARGMITEATSQALPTVSAVADYTRLDREPRFQVGGASVSAGDRDQYSAGLEVRQALFRGGAILSAMRSSRWQALAADEQVRLAMQTVIFDTSQAYYDVLLAQHSYAVNRSALESAQAHLRDAKLRRDQGLASDFDVLRAQVEVSTYEAAAIQQRNRISVAKTRLLLAMGASQESQVSLADELAYKAEDADLDEAVRMAFENRPDLYLAEMGVHVQHEAMRSARSRYLPTVDAWFRQSWERPDPRAGSSSDWGDAWTAGVSARWPLFDGFGRRGQMVREQARLRKRSIELADAEEHALQQVQEAVLRLQDAEELVASQSMNLERAEEALRLAEVEYRQGVIDSVTLTEARAALTHAKGLYYDSLHRHAMARLGLRRAKGVLEPPPGGAEEAAEQAARPGEAEEFSGEAFSPTGNEAKGTRQ